MSKNKKSRQDKYVKMGEAPVFIQLSTSNITDTERICAMQLTQQFADTFGFPHDEKHLKPLTLAFCNGISFAREWAKLTDEERRKTEEYYAPLVRELFYTPDDPTLN